MSKFARLSAAVFLLMLNISCRGGAGARSGAGDYMPLAVGNEWHYRVFGKNVLANAAAEVRIIKKRRDGIFIADHNGQFYGWGKVRGYVCFEDEALTKSSRCLRLPPMVGDKWKERDPKGRYPRQFWEIVARENIKTPAGLFADCVRVEMKEFNSPIEHRYWFKENVGVVRFSQYDRRRDAVVSGYVLTGYNLKSTQEKAGPDLPDSSGE